MKIAIYANMRDGGAGGAQTLTAALIRALGQLEGPEEYLLIGPPEHLGWLEEVRGPNQKIFQLKRSLDTGVRRLLSRAQKTLSFRTPVQSKNPYVRTAPFSGSGDVVPLSNGIIESSGANVVHFPSQQFVVSSLPSVYNPHDLQHLHLPQFFKPDELFRRELFYPFACRLASRVVVASEWIAADVREQYALPASKVVVVPWGGQTDRFPDPSADDLARVEKRYQLSTPYIFYPAVPWPHKNHSTLLAAFASLRTKNPGLLLVLCGEGTEESGQLAHTARRRGQSEDVRFLGHVPGSDLRALYKRAEVVAVPTLYEAVSGPIAEAWLEGTPVACSDIPQLRGQANGAAVFFDPASSESMESSLAQLLSERDLRSHLARSGREKLSAVKWSETADRYRSVYRDVAMSKHH